MVRSACESHVTCTPACHTAARAQQLSNTVLRSGLRAQRLRHNERERGAKVVVSLGGVEGCEGEAEGGACVALGCCVLEECEALLRFEGGAGGGGGVGGVVMTVTLMPMRHTTLRCNYLPWAASVRLGQQHGIAVLRSRTSQHRGRLVAVQRSAFVSVAAHALLKRSTKSIPARRCCRHNRHHHSHHDHHHHRHHHQPTLTHHPHPPSHAVRAELHSAFPRYPHPTFLINSDPCQPSHAATHTLASCSVHHTPSRTDAHHQAVGHSSFGT